MSEAWQSVDSGGFATSISHVMCYGRWNPTTKEVQKKVDDGDWENFGTAESADKAGAKLWDWANEN